MALPLESVVAFLYGLVLLSLWALAANENSSPIKELIKLSSLFFLAPILFIVALAHSVPGFMLIFIPFVPLFEEWLKRSAANHVKSNETAVFFLVTLFGVWELAISKSLMPLFPGWSPVSSGWGVAVFIWLVSLTVIMHAATAAIYAFHPAGDGKLRYWPCVAVHWCFNASRALYGEVPFDEVSSLSLMIDSAVWVALLLILLGRTNPPLIRSA